MHGPVNTDKIATELKKLRGILHESYVFTILNVKQPATTRSKLPPFIETKKKKMTIILDPSLHRVSNYFLSISRRWSDNDKRRKLQSISFRPAVKNSDVVEAYGQCLSSSAIIKNVFRGKENNSPVHRRGNWVRKVSLSSVPCFVLLSEIDITLYTAHNRHFPSRYRSRFASLSHREILWSLEHDHAIKIQEVIVTTVKRVATNRIVFETPILERNNWTLFDLRTLETDCRYFSEIYGESITASWRNNIFPLYSSIIPYRNLFFVFDKLLCSNLVKDYYASKCLPVLHNEHTR